MSPSPPGDDGPPEYRVYRSRPRLRDRLRPGDALGRLRPGRRGGQRDQADKPRTRRRITPGRVVRWLVLLVLAWLLVSLAVFLVSAQLAMRASPATEEALSGGSSLLTGSTILVLGSDARSRATSEPGAGGPARADSILLLRASFGSVRRLSILRDTFADIPGHPPQKMNAAYALGGAPLMVRTVEGFLGNDLGINHVIEVSFDDFPALVDSLGGIDVTLRRCISSDPFGGRRFRLRAGDRHLNGRQALAFARVRKNRCAPNEDDRARARRQQQVLAAIRSRMLSPAGFARLPLVAWQAPRTLRTDMAGPGLLGLFADVVTGGAGSTNVLRPSGVGPGTSLIVSEGDKQRAVQALLEG
jgi:LCP family protein required for cell wall assembly